MGLAELEAVWDYLPAAEAVAYAWMDPGPRHGTWHRTAREEVAYRTDRIRPWGRAVGRDR